MSFRDVGMQRPVHRSRRELPTIHASPLPEEFRTPTKARSKQRHSFVLHGKVQNVMPSESTDSDDPSTFAKIHSARLLEQEKDLIRKSIQRRSTFAQLTHETQLFQKVVADLEHTLQDSGDSPEMSWRSRILIRSAQETDKDLWEKLHKFEKTLMVKGGTTKAEVRTAQAACMKLHRDFKRSHKLLVMLLSKYERLQRAEISRLGAVGWSEAEEKHEDFYERAMRDREAELNRMNKSMHHVSEIYQDLAVMVDGQQDEIDMMEDDIRQARVQAEAAAGEVGCLVGRDRFCGAFEFDEDLTFLTSKGLRRENIGREQAPPGSRVQERFYWSMPFETMTADLTAVHQDIVGLGKSMLSESQKYQWFDEEVPRRSRAARC